jgi:tetratricopeptide (TPR) repeat protein
MLDRKYEQAEAEFRAALAARPDMAAARQNLQLVMAARKGFANIGGVAAGPGWASAEARARALVNAGGEHAAAGRNGDALKCYQQAIELSPQLADAHFNLGNLQFRTGHLADAEASYREAIRLNPSDAEARFRLGGVYVEQKRWREAEEAWTRALALKPDHAGVRKNLALLRQRMAQESPGGRPTRPDTDAR